MSKLNLPKFDVVEYTALEFALVFYEACRNQGMKSKHKTARLFALHNYQRFIPKALEYLIDILGKEGIHDNVKEKIYIAIQERVNDPEVNSVLPSENVIPELDLKKILESIPEKPVTIKTDIFDKKKSLKSRLKEDIAHV